MGDPARDFDDMFDNEEVLLPKRAAPEPGEEDFDRTQSWIFHAWHQWHGRMREQAQRHGTKPGLSMWWHTQRERFREALRLEYGQSEPSDLWCQWRKDKLRELGRADDAKAMEGRQPWD